MSNDTDVDQNLTEPTFETSAPGGAPWGADHIDVITQGERRTLKHLLPTGAITASTIAVLGATPAPVIGHNREIMNLAIGASVILWLGLWMVKLADRINNGVGETRADVREGWKFTGIGKLLEEAGQPIGGTELTLPTPRGKVRAVATEIDGETILAGIDMSAHLADVVDLQAAIADRDDRAVQ